jgi:hypothetical protein
VGQKVGRENYEATGIPGTRVAWGLGGKLNLADLIEIFGPVISGGDLDIGAILGAVPPLFAGFYSGVVPNVEIDPIAEVADVNDINGDGSTEDLVPDYANFPALPRGDMVLKVPMDQITDVTIPAMPSDGAGGTLYDGVILLAGVMVVDAGLVPLGLSAGMDAASADDTPDGQIDNVALAVSDVAGRLPAGSYERVLIALALNFGKLTDPDNTDPLVISGQLHKVADFNSPLTLNTFMEPAAYTYDAGKRQVDITTLPADTSTVLMLGSGDSGSWQMFHPGGSGLVDLPAAPVHGDRSDVLGIGVLKFSDGVSYSDMIAFNDNNLVDLVRLVSDFVIVSGEAGGLDTSCATSHGKGGLFGLFGLGLLLLGLALRRRCTKIGDPPRYKG